MTGTISESSVRVGRLQSYLGSPVGDSTVGSSGIRYQNFQGGTNGRLRTDQLAIIERGWTLPGPAAQKYRAMRDQFKKDTG